MLGSLFGATEVVTVAFAEDEGHPGLTGVLLAIWAMGSLIAGIITGCGRVEADARAIATGGHTGLAW